MAPCVRERSGVHPRVMPSGLGATGHAWHPCLVSAALVLLTPYLRLGMEAYARQDAKPAAA